MLVASLEKVNNPDPDGRATTQDGRFEIEGESRSRARSATKSRERPIDQSASEQIGNSTLVRRFLGGTGSSVSRIVRMSSSGMSADRRILTASARFVCPMS
jgi:hypothetical protein